MSAAQDLLIVIPCLNEERHLPELLDQFLVEDTDALIVIADGGSTDRSREIVRERMRAHPRLRLLPNPLRIQSAGVNLAVREFAEGRRWLVRVDAHCRYRPGYVQGLLASAAATGADSVVVSMRSVGRGCFQKAAAAAQNSKLGTGGSPHRHGGDGRFVDHGHHALMDVALFRRVGGYDERLSCNEDFELDARLRRAGGRIWLEPGLAIDYFPRRTPLSLFRQYWNYGRGRATTRAMLGEPLRLRQLLPLAVPFASLFALAAPLFPPAVLPLAAWMAICLTYGALLRDHDRSPCTRGAGIAAMIMHFAWGWGFLTRQFAPERRAQPATQPNPGT